MSREFLGVVLGLGASLAFESGYLLMTQQSRLVGRAGRPGGRLLLSLVHRRLWLLAIALDGVGIVLELFGLREASLIVIQPLMSIGLIGLVVGAAIFLGERINWRLCASRRRALAPFILTGCVQPCRGVDGGQRGQRLQANRRKDC